MKNAATNPTKPWSRDPQAARAEDFAGRERSVAGPSRQRRAQRGGGASMCDHIGGGPLHKQSSALQWSNCQRAKTNRPRRERHVDAEQARISSLATELPSGTPTRRYRNQFSTLSPCTRRNSRSLSVTITISSARACAAIRRSFAPIGVPAASSATRATP